MAIDNGDVEICQLTDSGSVGTGLRRELTECWIAVTNAGGAAGFPFPPVGSEEVAPAVDRVVEGLDPGSSRVLLARAGEDLAGWVRLSRERHRLTAHRGTVNHLQAHPAFRSRGIGSALMGALRAAARDDLGLEQLQLAVRGGDGLEGFYARLGWRVTGCWPDALRFGDGDYRDEVLMALCPL